MPKPMELQNSQLDSGNGVLTLLLGELRGVTPRPVCCNSRGEFQAALTGLSRKYHIRVQRTNLRPLEEESPGVRRNAWTWVRAVLRAGDWVIRCGREEAGAVFQLAWGLEEDRVLLGDGGTAALEPWLESADCFWLITLTFAKAEGGSPCTPSQVRWMQRRLNLVEGTGLAVDGIYGPDTARAVEQFSRHWACREPGSILPLEEELAQRLAI